MDNEGISHVSGVNDTLACGMTIQSDQWTTRGIMNIKLTMCHVYDWNQQKELSILYDPSGEINYDLIYSSNKKMCSEGKYITQVKVYEDWSGYITANQPGSVRLKFICDDPLGSSGTQEEQDLRNGNDNRGEVNPDVFRGSENRYLCGIKDSYIGNYLQCGVICGPDDAGVVKFKGVFCEYNCQGILSQINDIEDQVLDVNPPVAADPYSSSTRDYWQTSQKVGKFTDYFSYKSLDGQCQINQCVISSNQGSVDYFKIGQPNIDLIYGVVDLYEANTDPSQLFSQELYFECQVSNQNFPDQTKLFQSEKFNVELQCPSNIEIFEPNNLESSQKREASHISSSYPYYEFGSYQTKTKACVVTQYLVSAHETEGVVPYGVVDSNPYTEPYVSGTVNGNTYQINIMNGQTPAFYDFRIKVESMGGNWQWFPSNSDSSIKYRLISKCPDTVEVFPVSTYETFFQTYLGATNNMAVYEFVQFTSNLPMCQQIVNYQITATGLSYPSVTCMTDPCTHVDIDTSSTGDIVFQFRVETSIDAGTSSVSDQITIKITQTEESPTISAPVISDTSYVLNSVATFTFERFTCSTGCMIDYYLISGTNSDAEIPPISQGVSGLGTIRDLSFSVDTSSVSTVYSFYIFSRLKILESHYIFSNLVTISIECGSETISLVQSSYSHRVLQPSAGTFLLTTAYSGKFSSSTTQCPLVGYSSPTTSTFLSFLTGQTIQILLEPFRETIEILAHTEKVTSAPMQVEFTVCGKEVVKADGGVVVNTVQPGERIIITQATYVSYFETSFDPSNSHQDCTVLIYNLFLGENCQGSASGYFSFSGNDLLIQIQTPGTFILCLKAETFGYVKATKLIKIQVCGDEEILFEGDILKLGMNPSDPLPIDLQIEMEFTSSRVECPVITYELTGYVGSQLLLSDDGSNLQVLTNDSFTSDGIFLKATSESGQFVQMPIDIQVCGFEKVMVKKKKLELVWISNSYSHFEIDYKEIFESNNTEYCPINRYTFEMVDPESSTLPSWSVLIKPLNKLVFYVAQFQFKPTENFFAEDEHFKFLLKAWTVGNQTESYEIDLTMIDQRKSIMYTFLTYSNFTNKIDYNVPLDTWSEGNCKKLQWKIVEFAEYQISENTPQDRLELYEDIFSRKLFHFDFPIKNKTGDRIEILEGYLNLDEYEKLMLDYKQKNKLLPDAQWFISNAAYDCILYIEGITFDDEKTDCMSSLSETIFLKKANITSVIKVQNKTIVLERPYVESSIFYNSTIEIRFSEPMKQLDSKMLCQALTLSTISITDNTEFVGSCQDYSLRQLKESNNNLASKMLRFSWKVDQQQEKQIKISIEFTTPQYVSQGIHGLKDQLKIQIRSLVNLNDSKVLPIDYYYQLPTIIGQIDKSIQRLGSTSLSSVIGIGLNAIITSKAKQDLWGMLSTQQIFIYMIILRQSETVPQTLQKYNSYVSNLFQEDMYPMDLINDHYFDFSPTESPIEQFEELGLEGSNFIKLTGSYYINFLVCIIGVFTSNFLHFMATKYYKYKFMRILGMQIEKTNIWYAILNFYFQMYLDLLICSLISFISHTERVNRSDLISYVFFIVTFSLMMIIPIMIAYILNKNFRNLMEQNTQDKFGFAYEDLYLLRKETALFNVFFLLRRCFFAVILVFMNEYSSLQLILFYFKTFFFCLYLMIYKPFLTRESNFYQVINEICILLSVYVLFIMSDQNLMGTSERDTFSYPYIFFNLTSIFFNLYQVLNKKIFVELPLLYKRYTIAQAKKQKQQMQEDILKQLELRAQVRPDDNDAQMAVKLIKMSLEIKDAKEKYAKDREEFERHLRWLQANELPTVVLDTLKEKLVYIQKIISKNEDRLKQFDQQDGIRLGAQINHVNSLLFSENMLMSQPKPVFPHLDPLYFNGAPLFLSYDLPEWLVSLDPKYKQDEILKYKQSKLDHFLKDYTMHDELVDGDEALAMALCQDKCCKSKIRRQLCQYMLVNKGYWGEKAGMQYAFQFYIENYIQKKKKFSHLVIFEAAAKLYDRPIILFSCLNETPYLDKVCNALTLEANQKDPIYLYVDHKYNYTVLAHPKDTVSGFIPYQRWPKSILYKKTQYLQKIVKKSPEPQKPKTQQQLNIKSKTPRKMKTGFKKKGTQKGIKKKKKLSSQRKKLDTIQEEDSDAWSVGPGQMSD